MNTKILYRFVYNNQTIDSLQKPDLPYTERYRLIAEDSKVLTKNNINFYSVIDIDKEELSLWQEVKNNNYIEE